MSYGTDKAVKLISGFQVDAPVAIDTRNAAANQAELEKIITDGHMPVGQVTYQVDKKVLKVYIGDKEKAFDTVMMQGHTSVKTPVKVAYDANGNAVFSLEGPATFGGLTYYTSTTHSETTQVNADKLTAALNKAKPATA